MGNPNGMAAITAQNGACAAAVDAAAGQLV